MCAIVGSFSKSKAKELYQLNSYRGELSYSLTTFRSMSLCSNVVIQLTYKSPGKIPDSLIDNCPISEGDYIITHSQAPTTSTKNIHPATCNGALLWHNGIIKQKTFTAETLEENLPHYIREERYEECRKIADVIDELKKQETATENKK